MGGFFSVWLSEDADEKSRCTRTTLPLPMQEERDDAPGD